MKPVKTRPRFKCDFCSRTSTERAMLKHEKICWYNPDRVCDLCQNEGVYEVDPVGDGEWTQQVLEECPYCKQFRKQGDDV